MTRHTVVLYTLVIFLGINLGVAAVLLVHHWLWSERTASVSDEDGSYRPHKSIPVPKVRFTDVTEVAGIRFRHFNGATGQKLLPETMGSGVAVIDYDRDGHQDLLFVNGCSWPGDPEPSQAPTLALYRNRGDGTFEDVTEQVGLNVTVYGMGVTVGDFDNDGYPDIFVTGVGGNHLFHNVEGKGGRRRFVDVTEEAGVGGSGGWPKGATKQAFSAWQKPIAFASSATFLDYDGDGRLDLFVCYYVAWSPARDLSSDATLAGGGRAYLPPMQFDGVQCVLYRNLDGNHFQDVSVEAGIQVVEGVGSEENMRKRPVGKSLGVIACDPDEDGWPDIVVANDTVRNFFFHNISDGKGGRRFVEMGLRANIAYSEGQARGAMGIDWGEYAPGKNALVIGNFANEPNTFLTLDNPSKLLFSDSALTVGLSEPSRRPLKFGTLFFDFDNDGRLDLLTCNGHLEPEITQVQTSQTYEQSVQLFWNTGQEKHRFEPVTKADAGADLFKPLVGRGCAVLDFNGDGKLDIVLTENNGQARLLRNDSALKHHWIRLTLEGDGKRSNRSAIGAQITVEAGDLILRRQVSGARGYLSQSELPVTIGLGDLDRGVQITVRWPGRDTGPPGVWKNLEVDRAYELRQGDPNARPLPK